MNIVRRALMLLVTILAAVSLGSTSASAATSAKKAIWGPLDIAGRPAMPIYADLGVGTWQSQLRWERVAAKQPANPRDPADPAYAWPKEIDRAIAEGGPVGVRTLLLVQGTPGWANGQKASNVPPTDPRDYADFITAAAKRYPAVRKWMIWGEPNGSGLLEGKPVGNFLGVQYDRGRPLPRSRQAGPRLYARILDLAYSRLKAASRRNLVIGGNTWTAGVVRPRHWIPAMKLPSGRPPRMDYYGHNPMGPRFPNAARTPTAAGLADINDLDTLARDIDRRLGRRANGKRIGIFLSEYVIPTDHTNFVFPFFFSREEQARRVTAAMRLVRRSPRVVALGIFRSQDPPVRADGMQLDSGLIDREGNPKPAYGAFKRG